MYLVHIIPMFAAVLAVSVYWYYSNRIIPRWLLTFGVFCLLTLQLGGVFYVIRQNDYRKSYLPAVEYLKNVPESKNNLIMGSAELGFALEFPDNFIDDWRLGFYSGKKPELIVIGKQYEGMFNGLRNSEPETYLYITEFLNREYRQIYDYQAVKIYKRK